MHAHKVARLYALVRPSPTRPIRGRTRYLGFYELLTVVVTLTLSGVLAPSSLQPPASHVRKYISHTFCVQSVGNDEDQLSRQRRKMEREGENEGIERDEGERKKD